MSHSITQRAMVCKQCNDQYLHGQQLPSYTARKHDTPRPFVRDECVHAVLIAVEVHGPYLPNQVGGKGSHACTHTNTLLRFNPLCQ